MWLTAQVPSIPVMLMHRAQHKKWKARSRRWAEMFVFKKLPSGNLDKSTLVCKLRKKEFAHHRSASSLHYHLTAKHRHRPSGLQQTVGSRRSGAWIQDQGLEFNFMPCDQFNPNILYSYYTLWCCSDENIWLFKLIFVSSHWFSHRLKSILIEKNVDSCVKF